MFKTVLVIGLGFGVLQGQEQAPDERLRTATTVLHEILSAPDKGIPQDLLAKAQGVMIVPGLKKNGLPGWRRVRSRVRGLPSRRGVGRSRGDQVRRR